MLEDAGFVDVVIGEPVDTFGGAGGGTTPGPTRSTGTPSPAGGRHKRPVAWSMLTRPAGRPLGRRRVVDVHRDKEELLGVGGVPGRRILADKAAGDSIRIQGHPRATCSHLVLTRSVPVGTGPIRSFPTDRTEGERRRRRATPTSNTPTAKASAPSAAGALDGEPVDGRVPGDASGSRTRRGRRRRRGRRARGRLVVVCGASSGPESWSSGPPSSWSTSSKWWSLVTSSSAGPH